MNNAKPIDHILSGSTCKHVHVDVVRVDDAFEFSRETDSKRVYDTFQHLPDAFGSSAIVGAYAVATLSDGSVMVERVPLDDLKLAAKQAQDPEFWRDWFGEMSKNLALRRLSKRLGISEDARDALSVEFEKTNGKPTKHSKGKAATDALNQAITLGVVDTHEEE